MQSTLVQPTSSESIFILPFHLRLCLLSGLFFLHARMPQFCNHYDNAFRVAYPAVFVPPAQVTVPRDIFFLISNHEAPHLAVLSIHLSLPISCSNIFFSRLLPNPLILCYFLRKKDNFLFYLFVYCLRIDAVSDACYVVLNIRLAGE
jgi:hypothetical protein